MQQFFFSDDSWFWLNMKSEWRGEVQQVAQRQFLCHQTLNHTKAYHCKILDQHYIFNWLLFKTFFHPCKVSFINDHQSANNVAIPVSMKSTFVQSSTAAPLSICYISQHPAHTNEIWGLGHFRTAFCHCDAMARPPVEALARVLWGSQNFDFCTVGNW